MNLREYAQEQQKVIQQPASAAARDRATNAYSAIYRAVFDFHKRHYPFPQTPEDWQAAAQDLAQTAASTNNNPFATSLLFAVIDELERQWKGAQGMNSS